MTHPTAVLLGVIAATLLSTPASGQDAPSHLTVEASLDVPSRYVFRGYEVDERGAVFQPAVAVTAPLQSSSTGALRALSVSALAWASLHLDSRTYPSDLGVYEVDVGASLDATFSNGGTASLVYTSYLAPTGAFEVIHEIGLAIEPVTLGGGPGFSFSPSALLAQEFYDGGGSEDTYLQVGGTLGLPSTGVLSWSVPLNVGMSLDGFYTNSDGGNEWFGFAGTGLELEASFFDLGLGRAPVALIAGVDVSFTNRSAGLTHERTNDVLWTSRVGLAVAP